MKQSLIDRAVFAYTRAGLKKKNIKTVKSLDNLYEGNYNRYFIPDHVCSDGSPANMYVWKGNEKDLMISLCGGGVITSVDDCKYPVTFKSFLGNKKMAYSQNGGELFDFVFFFLNKNLGIISPTEENPFASWSKVFIPYVSADFHTGTADFEYENLAGEKEMFHCNGYINFETYMKTIKERWPSPERLIITGSSAGSFGTSALAGKIIDMYPECQNITVYCDSSYLYAENWKDIAENLWKCPDDISSVIHTSDLGGDWLEALCRNYGSRAKILYSCSTNDGVLARFSQLINEGTYVIKVDQKWLDEVCEGYKERIRRFENEGLKVYYYVNNIPDKLSGGTVHCISQDLQWSQHQQDGITPAKWVSDAVNNDLYDVGRNLLSM